MTAIEIPKLWEILLPVNSNEGVHYSLKHYKKWNKKAKKISKGITILRSAKGSWESPEGSVFEEEMIPVRIRCTTEEIKTLSEYTLKHYKQQTVWAYEVSSNIIETTKE